ncbi:DUF4231 domain-containing protein [Actinosynnema sp. NPDC047251]|uniref:Putative membrane protein n=1 Tax=Saccharothrix espanaensis (strain ATCC 51144 / DSM 44229 / JCM 9112 / NBRC 15066 / NRRL 15764) TaxID=1179773 RepID=K0JWE5_SACES|nr:DUF4231 domain-containing protein [Saccharothrix espanaensis]CCH32130.1 putative membrane protein [Saccharothrix espanaensis DSM 44229]
MTDADLPGFFHDAERVSDEGKRQTLLLSRLRLVSAIVAALGGALTWKLGSYNLWGFVSLAGFLLALFAEILLWVLHPEQKWNGGRAVAEGVKSLAWRFAVAGDPFPAPLPQAKHDLREKIGKVVEAHGRHLGLAGANPSSTGPMAELRAKSFEERKREYRETRVLRQKDWYARRANENEARTVLWRYLLIGGELVAVVLALLRAVDVWDVDISGVMAAAVAGGAAWLGLKQHQGLYMTYSAAASDLALLHEDLADVPEDGWAAAVADTEDAIGREHSAWLASRPSAA